MSFMAQRLHSRVLVRGHQAVIGTLDLLEPLLRLLNILRMLIRVPYLQQKRCHIRCTLPSMAFLRWQGLQASVRSPVKDSLKPEV